MYDPNQFTQSMAPMGTAMNVPTGMGGPSAPGMRPQMGMNRDRPDMGPGNNPFSPGYRPQMGMDRDRSDMGPGPRPPDMFGQQPPGMFGQQPPGMLGQPPGMLAGTFGQPMPQGQAQALNYPTQQGQFLGQVAQPMQQQFLSGSQNAPAPNTQSQVAQLSNSLGNMDPRYLFGNPSALGGNQMPQGGQASLGGAVPGGQYNQAIPQQGALGGGFGFSNPFAPQNGSFNGTQALGGFNGLSNSMEQAKNNPYQTQNYIRTHMPGYDAPQATQPFNLGLGSFNGI